MVPLTLRNRSSEAAQTPKRSLAARLAGEAAVDVSQPALDCPPRRRTSPTSGRSFGVFQREDRFAVGILEASRGFGGTFAPRGSPQSKHSCASHVATWPRHFC